MTDTLPLILLLLAAAVVPLLVLIPALSQPLDAMAGALLPAGAKAAILLALVLFIGQRALSAWFHLVARRRSAEPFMLNGLLITLGLAWLTELAGLSPALAAFTAGMLIGETEYRYQAEEDIKPFRDVLLGLFFVAIGMRLNVPQILGQWPLVAAILAMLLAPLVVHFSDRLVFRFVAAEWLLRSMQLTQLAAQSLGADKHATICGYGRTGRHLARFLEAERFLQGPRSGSGAGARSQHRRRSGPLRRFIEDGNAVGGRPDAGQRGDHQLRRHRRRAAASSTAPAMPAPISPMPSSRACMR